MARQRQGQVVTGDAAPVVAYPQQFHPALLDIDVDTPSAGIQTVFQQLLDDRGRALHHFARGDLVGQARAEQLDTGDVGHSWDAKAVLGIFSAWPVLSSSDLRLFSDRRLLIGTS
jgi:hypothetical protein